MFFVNGDYYKGAFKNDMRNGKGEYIWKDGDIYTGDFVNGLYDINLFKFSLLSISLFS